MRLPDEKDDSGDRTRDGQGHGYRDEDEVHGEERRPLTCGIPCPRVSHHPPEKLRPREKVERGIGQQESGDERGFHPPNLTAVPRRRSPLNLADPWGLR